MPYRACRAVPPAVRLEHIVVLLVLALALLPAAAPSRGIAAPVPPAPKPTGIDVAAAAPAVEAADTVAPAASVVGSSGRLLSCSNYGGPNWITTDTDTYQTVRSCTLAAPGEGIAYINASATGYLPRRAGGWLGAFQLAIGATPATLQGDGRTERTLFLRDDPDLPDDPDSQTSKTLATSLLLPLAAGTYTFALQGISGIGEVRLSNPAISVVFVPRTTADIVTCGQAGNIWIATPDTSFQSIVSCPLQVARDGFALVSATSGVAAVDRPYEARFRVGTDLAGASQSDRYVNVYPRILPVPGTQIVVGSENVASSALLPVRAGTTTFHFLGYRYDGTGTMSAIDPSLSVIYFPAGSLSVFACGAAGQNLVSVDSLSFTPVVSCQLAVPRDSLAFVESSSSASIGSASSPAQEYEGRSRIGVDSTDGLEETERRFTVDSDEGDGSDRPLAEAVVLPLARGSHTISLNVRRSLGTQPVRLYTPTLTVLVAGPRDLKVLPMITRRR